MLDQSPGSALSDDASSPEPAGASTDRRRRGGARSARRARAMRGQRRGLAERVTLPMLLGVVAALLGFVAALGVLRDRRQTFEVLVPVERVPAGATLTAENTRVDEVAGSVAFSGGLADASMLGSVVGRTLEPGEPVLLSSIAGETAQSSKQVMPLPIGSWAVTGGEVELGDRLDVIDTRGDVAEYVLRNAIVVGRSGDGGGGLTASSELWVSVEVEEDQALVVAELIAANDFVIVRSGGGG